MADAAQGGLEFTQVISMGLMLTLERLSPAERAVFILRDVFDFKRADIARALGLTEIHCRQLLSRAGRASSPPATLPSGTASGDLAELFGLLAADVVLHSDGGGRAPALPRPIHGPDRVARATLHGLKRLLSQGVEQRIVSINGEPGIVSYLDGRPQSALTLRVVEDRIEVLYIVTNPDKLSGLPRLEKHCVPRTENLTAPPPRPISIGLTLAAIDLAKAPRDGLGPRAWN
ncbi:sigma factor-like helix-turn-helix DNA-binding protein [Caulobacter sp. SSI4214]|uniref:sigma factor-like helix-turn-helix DNA-binding protein n=1 Tax=Caulobacter sp. SSI4214 TaxID=2575739 RepID=UPI0014388636|nr:sigma factor-like helix-turn-helix DNA-binding protein [Caulobacter sp. SSI4214]